MRKKERKEKKKKVILSLFMMKHIEKK